MSDVEASGFGRGPWTMGGRGKVEFGMGGHLHLPKEATSIVLLINNVNQRNGGATSVVDPTQRKRATAFATASNLWWWRWVRAAAPRWTCP